MQQFGYVVGVDKNIVTIKINRESACGGNCVSCGGCKKGACIMIECIYKEQEPVQTGDTVIVTMDNKSFFKNAFLCYGLEIFGIIAGAVVGYMIMHKELASFIGAVLGFIVFAVILHFVDKKRAEKTAFEYKKKDKC